MSPRFPSPVIDQMLVRGQITRVAPSAGCVPPETPPSTAATGTPARRPLTSTKRSRWRPPFINVHGSSWTTRTRTELVGGPQRPSSAGVAHVGDRNHLA
jgi:hypothetical protein